MEKTEVAEKSVHCGGTEYTENKVVFLKLLQSVCSNSETHQKPIARAERGYSVLLTRRTSVNSVTPR